MKAPKTEGAMRDQAKAFDDMLKRAITRRESQIKTLMQHEEELKKRKKVRSVDLKKLNKFISVPIIVGVLAAMITYQQYGWDFLKRTLLSWTIGVTIVTTVIAIMEKHSRKL